MRELRAPAAWLCLSLLAGACLCAADHVEKLDKKTFEEKTTDGKISFVKFYAPWCGHCKKLAPIWEQLAAEFSSNDSARVAHVDCTKAKSLCKDQGIGGYPTLKVFYDGREVETYRGVRDLSSLSTFLSESVAKLTTETTA